MKLYTCIHLAGVLGTIGVTLSGAGAQQVLEIDFENGRDVINDDRRAILAPVVIDHRERLLYARDPEEPFGVMVFSMATGERIRTYRIREGEGPSELTELSGFALASGGGIYLQGAGKTLHLDATGDVVSYWRPAAPEVRTICELGGQPTIAVQGGLKRRGPDGTEEIIGPRVMDHGTWLRRQGDVIHDFEKWSGARLVCSEDEAYLVVSNLGDEESFTMRGSTYYRRHNIAPDSIFVYSIDGNESHLDVPMDFVDDDSWNENLKPSIDALGNLVLAARNGRYPGAIIDPDTGCYGVFRNKEHQLYRDLAGVYADSALVMHSSRVIGTTESGEKMIQVFAGEVPRVSLHPIRRVSGDPCPGMLSSVRGESGASR